MSTREEFPAEVSLAELQLATRNHGMPLEAMRYDVTPVGLHYLLIHYDIPHIDPDEWRLEVTGSVELELSLDLDELWRRPRETITATFECAGNGRALLRPRPLSQPWLLEAIGTASWTGTPLRPLLEEAGVGDGVVEVVFTGADRGVEGDVEQDYERALPIGEAMREDVLLAYEVNGVPLPPQHGFPLRLLVPGWYGMTNVKWLRRITVVDEPFGGYQNVRSYRFRKEEDEEGEPVTRMAPRALMVPPGIPDFLTRTRIVSPGEVGLTGRAWSGWGPIERVEVSTDSGETWMDADLAEPVGPFAWRGWSFVWNADPGEAVLCCRATDASGNTQPAGEPWNLGGYAVNPVHRVPVVVRN